MKAWKLWALGASVVTAGGAVLVSTDMDPHVEYLAPQPVEMVDSVPASPSAYGIPLAGYVVEQGVVRGGNTFSDLLAAHGVTPRLIDSLVKVAAPVFDVRRLRAGRPIAFIFDNDSLKRPRYFVYEADQVQHIVIGLTPPSARKVLRPIDVTERSASVTVTGSLYRDLSEIGADPMLTMQLANILAWTVDFYRMQKEDRFTVVYNERTVDGERFGDPEVLAVRYASGEVIRNGYRFNIDSNRVEYFDDEGNSLRKAFLQAPLKYSRISSGFSTRRFHPVQKRIKAHLGTDYAAPYGTPILTVGDGVVDRTGWTAGNGNYVTVRHNATYSTQYLHMRKILATKGQRVAQGDVIGEVGSTGLATGPHVCFRFWKNGQQVDHRREELPSAEPVASARRPNFEIVRSGLKEKLDEAEGHPGQVRETRRQPQPVEF